MYLIKVCPECKTKIRFPIDKGTIRVKCTCGYNFIANPDDTGIYRDASFDLSHTTPGLKKMTPLRRWIGDIRVRGFVSFLITGALNLKYKIQNFSLLPDVEKKKIVLAFLFIGAGIIGLIVTLYILTHGSTAPDKVVI
jgi:hypothetical protein